MKMEVVAYLTAIINSYERKVNNPNIPITYKNTHKAIVDDLGGLLEYIMDCKEVVQATPTESLLANAKLIEEIREYKQDIARLKQKNDQLEALWKGEWSISWE